jgi:hypothetical protein
MTPADENEAVVAAANAALDALHDADPRTVPTAAGPRPREAVWSASVARWVETLAPDASPALRIAARAQHLERWTRPRADYPDGRAGYLRWRRDAGVAAAERAAGVVREAGGDEALAERVARLVRKADLRRDEAAAVLEDAACLAFLELDAEDFAARHEAPEVIRILARTWAKMSPAGRVTAAAATLPPAVSELLARATDDAAGSEA